MEDKKYVIFDVDGTLALNDERKKYIDGKNGRAKDWDTYHKTVHIDKPNWPVIKTLKIMRDAGYTIYLYSGRVESSREASEKWLKKYGITWEKFRMRPDSLRIPDQKLKGNWLHFDFPLPEDKEKILAIYDDRDKVVDMWRRNGIACFQVSYGNF
jgi:FMN phosphatase YigB (HAD superfamily)